MANDYKAINFEYLLIEHYKDLNINENELAVILVVNHLLKQHNDIITAEELAFKMNLDNESIDNVLSLLVRKNIIDLEINSRGSKMSLRPLMQKLFDQFKLDILKEEKSQQENINKMVMNCYAECERELKRTLSPVEVSRIQEWFAIGYDEQAVYNAIKDLKSQNRKVTIRNIDKKLLEKAKYYEREKEGITALSDNWTKSLDETVRIARTKWLQDDEK